MKVYNGEGAILGRLASQAAKDALLGEEVIVINAEKIIISGKKENTFAHEKERRDRKGYPLKSAKFSRLPDRFVRRSIRGMLPWKNARGKEAFKKIQCYVGIPKNVSAEKAILLQKQLPNLKYTTVAQVCKQLGGK